MKPITKLIVKDVLFGVMALAFLMLIICILLVEADFSPFWGVLCAAVIFFSYMLIERLGLTDITEDDIA